MNYNINYLIASLSFLILIFCHFMKRKTLNFGTNRSFLYLIGAGTLNICFSMLTAVLVSFCPKKCPWISNISMTAAYLSLLLLLFSLLHHIVDQFAHPRKYKYWRAAFIGVFSIMLFLILTNSWTRFFFTFWDDGGYSRGPLYFLMHLFADLCLLAGILWTHVHRTQLPAAKIHAIYELLLVIFIPFFVQIFFENTMIVGFGIALGITILFFTLDNPYYFIDGLTSAFDIHYFQDRARDQLNHQRKFHLLSVKLCQLKRINAVMGADIGNQLLLTAAKFLKTGSRKNLVFRISGSVFSIMCFSSEDFDDLYKKVRDFFSSPILLSDIPIFCPVIITKIDSAEQLETCDNLLAYISYLNRLAPSSAQCCVIEKNPENFQGFRYNQEIENFLDTAIEKDLFQVVFQPLYSVAEKKYVSIEALSRLRHPELGWISPELFIRIAEKNELVAQIGLLQLHRICRFIKHHPRLLTAIESVKINLSPAELIKADHIQHLIRTIRQYELPASFFQFEITETMATEYSETVMKTAAQCQEAGIKLCMDDFGSGFSNLNAVLRLPFDVIKLDRSLLTGICDEKHPAALYQSLLSIFHNMGFKVVAEGIETELEDTLVEIWGADLIQGYYYSRPLPEPELLQLLQIS